MLTAVPGGPLTSLVDHSVVLDFADEQSIVQTRFPTTAMTLLRTGLGEDPAPAIADCEAALAVPPPGRPVGVRALRLPRDRLDGGPGPRGGAQDA